MILFLSSLTLATLGIGGTVMLRGAKTEHQLLRQVNRLSCLAAQSVGLKTAVRMRQIQALQMHSLRRNIELAPDLASAEEYKNELQKLWLESKSRWEQSWWQSGRDDCSAAQVQVPDPAPISFTEDVSGPIPPDLRSKLALCDHSISPIFCIELTQAASNNRALDAWKSHWTTQP